jgi:hypothetical protein
MITTIQITQGHISAGKPRSRKHCPVSLAINDHVQRDCEVEAKYDQAEIIRDRRASQGVISADFVELPVEVGDFIEPFDGGETVQPFAFNIDIPASCLR